jgi:hypothetical protein
MNREEAINQLFEPLAINIQLERFNPQTGRMTATHQDSIIKKAMNQSGRTLLQKQTNKKL